MLISIMSKRFHTIATFKKGSIPLKGICDYLENE